MKNKNEQRNVAIEELQAISDSDFNDTRSLI